MAAKDYRICPALFNAYIAKVSKRNPNRMLEDRRIITDNEIMALIEWWVEQKCTELHSHYVDITSKGEIVLTLTPKGKLLEIIKKNLKEEQDGNSATAGESPSGKEDG